MGPGYNADSNHRKRPKWKTCGRTKIHLGDADDKYLCILDTGANVHIINNKSLFSSGSLKSCGKVQIEGTSGVNERISTSGVLYGLGEAYYDEKCFINVLKKSIFSIFL